MVMMGNDPVDEADDGAGVLDGPGLRASLEAISDGAASISGRRAGFIPRTTPPPGSSTTSSITWAIKGPAGSSCKCARTSAM